MQHVMHNLQLIAYNMQHSIRRTTQNMQLAAYRARRTAYNAAPTAYGIQRTAHNITPYNACVCNNNTMQHTVLNPHVQHAAHDASFAQVALRATPKRNTHQAATQPSLQPIAILSKPHSNLTASVYIAQCRQKASPKGAIILAIRGRAGQPTQKNNVHSDKDWQHEPSGAEILLRG